MIKIFTIISLLLCGSTFVSAQNEKIALLYETKANSGYFSMSGKDVAFIGSSVMIFECGSVENGREVWRTDGTTEGTYMIKDINPGVDQFDSPNSSHPEYFNSFGDHVYFRAYDGVHGIELWRTDGTEAGTVMVKDINNGGSGSLAVTSPQFGVYKGELYFMAEGSRAAGSELWKTDGTEAGTVLVKDINPGDRSGSNPNQFVVYEDLLYFTATPSYGFKEIWYTDGTAEGTRRLSSLPNSETPRPERLVVLNDLLIFIANLNNGFEMWRSDGTSQGTYELKDINTSGGSVSSDKEFVEYKGELYFKARSVEYGDELWKTNGTTAGTVLVKDINIYSGDKTYSSTPLDLTVFGDKLFFNARTESHGAELWVTDGTADGTTLYNDLYPGSNGGNPRGMTVYNNRLFFNGKASYWGGDLFSIGTDQSAMPVAHECVGFSLKDLALFSQFYVVNNTFCFQAELEENTGFELYKLEGTSTGITNEIENNSIRIFPNPVANSLNIEMEEAAFKAEIFNIQGVRMLSYRDEKAKDVSQLKPGMYLLKVVCADGITSRPFLKK
ncbi:MAG: T9SS type A sorting domain-containing protein [Marinilabiliaceae bacterium]|nr:T9SS type A sorting domain-containing protein [Marinilabiliaceae bacterium]